METSFKGEEELNTFVEKNEVPCFYDFIQQYSEKLIIWSIDKADIDALQLYFWWLDRFSLTLRLHSKVFSIRESKNRYDEEYWEIIRKGVLDLNKKDRLGTGVPFSSIFDGKYTHPTQLEEKSSKPAENTSDVRTESSEDDETIIRSIARKKLSGKLSNEDLNYLKNYKGDGSPRSDLFLLSSKLLQKDELSVRENAILELSLSGIYNYLDLFFVEIYDREIKRRSPPQINILNRVFESPDHAIMRLFEIIYGTNDINVVLYYVQTEKSRLTKNEERNTNTYVMLSIMEKVIEDTELWKSSSEEQEITYFRRFASILDILFKDTGVSLIESSETDSNSSRIEIEANKCMFNVDDASTSYSRKIDLTLKYDENEYVELCSNEWRKTEVTPDQKIKQQSTNLRVNAHIINELQGKYGDFHSILALDATGLDGYVYQLTKFDNYFIALPYLSIVIPKTYADVKNSKELLSTLFCLKSFYKYVVKKPGNTQVKETKIGPRSSYSVNPIVSRSKKEEIKRNTNVEPLLVMILLVLLMISLLLLLVISKITENKKGQKSCRIF